MRKRILCKLSTIIACMIMLVTPFQANANEEETTANIKENNKTYYSDTVWAGKADGFSKHGKIEKDDYNYGWEIGKFAVSGYSGKTKDADGNYIFLKNIDDEINLTFLLEQNINSLNGNDDLYIRDTEARDEYFQTPYTDFGRGTLIIRHTDYQGIKGEPVIYTDFFKAVSYGEEYKVSPDTKVYFFEEGDYEVALDYRVAKSKKIMFFDVKDPYEDYRVFFKFSIRNGNCITFINDAVTGQELSNTSITPNGFTINMANSKYLEVIVKKEVLSEGKDGLVEDVRYNRPASDGEVYTEEGIYTITTKNVYTNQTTPKKIYVGSDKVMMAYVNSNYSIPEINHLLEQGCQVNDDGEIIWPDINTETSTKIEDMTTSENLSADIKETDENKTKGSKMLIWIIIICYVVIISLVLVVTNIKKKKDNEQKENNEPKENHESKGNDEG